MERSAAVQFYLSLHSHLPMSVHPSHHRVGRPFGQTTFHRAGPLVGQSICPPSLPPAYAAPPSPLPFVHSSVLRRIHFRPFFLLSPSAGVDVALSRSLSDRRRRRHHHPVRPRHQENEFPPSRLPRDLPTATALLSLDADVILFHSEGNILRNRHCRGYGINPFDGKKALCFEAAKISKELWSFPRTLFSLPLALVPVLSICMGRGTSGSVWLFERAESGHCGEQERGGACHS